MSTLVNIYDAKMQLSKLLKVVEKGGEVIIANRGKPVAKLVPVEEPKKRALGFIKGSVPDEFFDPLPDDELKAWEL
jgi:prevent-host-death family protein